MDAQTLLTGTLELNDILGGRYAIYEYRGPRPDNNGLNAFRYLAQRYPTQEEAHAACLAISAEHPERTYYLMSKKNQPITQYKGGEEAPHE